MLGVSYLNTNRTGEAITELERALAMKPGDPSVRRPWGSLLQKGITALSGKITPPRQALGKAREYDARSGYLHYSRDSSSETVSRRGKILGRAVALLPNHAGVHARLGLVTTSEEVGPGPESLPEGGALAPRNQGSDQRITENRNNRLRR